MRLLLLLLWCGMMFGAEVVMVADEFPAMQTLARELEQRAGVTADIVAQDRMPAHLSRYRAVFVLHPWRHYARR